MSEHDDRLSEDAHDVLDAYRRSAPGDVRRRANLEAVRRRIEDAPARPAAAAAGLAWPIGWGVASAVAAAGLVWGLVELRSPTPTEPPATTPEAVQPGVAPASARPTEVTAPPMETGLEIEKEIEVAVPSPQRPARTEAPAPTPSASDLREETRLLRTVRASIVAGALDDAAAALADYTVAFPDGALREDAQAYRVVVACKRGEDAMALRRAFSLRYPDSPHVARIEAACGGSKK